MSNILFVCTANICRSPAAEAMAKSRYNLTRHRFASAGFLYDGREATPDMVRTLAEVDLDVSPHLSRILDAPLAAECDLILTMEARHLQDISIMSEEAYAKALPLAEAAERLSVARLAHQQVPLEQFVESLQDRDALAYLDSKWDVEDPYKRSRRKYRKAVEQISGLVDDVLVALA